MWGFGEDSNACRFQTLEGSDEACLSPLRLSSILTALILDVKRIINRSQMANRHVVWVENPARIQKLMFTPIHPPLHCLSGFLLVIAVVAKDAPVEPGTRTTPTERLHEAQKDNLMMGEPACPAPRKVCHDDMLRSEIY